MHEWIVCITLRLVEAQGLLEGQIDLGSTDVQGVIACNHRGSVGGGRSWKTALGFPRTGGRVLCVHGSVSVHGLWR